MTAETLAPPHLIQSPEALDALLADLAGVQRCALDTESNSLYVYYHHICLIQLSTEQADYLIDPLAIPDLAPLRAWIAEHPIEYTFHAAENDLLLLHRDFDFTFARIFDTLWAARILGWRRPSLATILEERFGVHLDKRWQRANWGQRPLSPELLHYARLDTHYLLPLRDMLAEELQRQGRWQEAQGVFTELTAIRWQEKEPHTMWRLRGVRSLSEREQAVLKALFDWREKQAQRRNLPPYKIMRNDTMLELARLQPATLPQLHQIKGISRRLPKSVAQRLLRVIKQGQRAPIPAPPAANHTGSRPSPAESALYDRLRGWRRQMAEQRGVETDVILTNDVLMTIARRRPQSMDELAALGVLGPWKLEHYGPAILKLCRS